jgi:hypothetical protein
MSDVVGTKHPPDPTFDKDPVVAPDEESQVKAPPLTRPLPEPTIKEEEGCP